MQPMGTNMLAAVRAELELVRRRRVEAERRAKSLADNLEFARDRLVDALAPQPVISWADDSLPCRHMEAEAAADRVRCTADELAAANAELRQIDRLVRDLEATLDWIQCDSRSTLSTDLLLAAVDIEIHKADCEMRRCKAAMSDPWLRDEVRDPKFGHRLNKDRLEQLANVRDQLRRLASKWATHEHRTDAS